MFVRSGSLLVTERGTIWRRELLLLLLDQCSSKIGD
uniref:Uncharacterized protein n=1 Tax=Anguilla anguilla TaxID=7936 RepID=A0A0E9SAL9_ANGAN